MMKLLRNHPSHWHCVKTSRRSYHITMRKWKIMMKFSNGILNLLRSTSMVSSMGSQDILHQVTMVVMSGKECSKMDKKVAWPEKFSTKYKKKHILGTHITKKLDLISIMKSSSPRITGNRALMDIITLTKMPLQSNFVGLAMEVDLTKKLEPLLSTRKSKVITINKKH